MLLWLKKCPWGLVILSFLLVICLGPAAKAEPLTTRTIAELAGSPKAKSGENRDFLVYSSAADQKSEYRFLIQSGLHGNERLPVEFVTWLMARYSKGQSLLNRLPRGSAIDFFPIASPDGYAANTRENGRGVNLNRNFSVLWGVSREVNGNAAFSEPETRAARDLLQTGSYTSAVDVHGYSNWLVLPSPPSLLAKSTPKLAATYRRWSTEIGEVMNKLLPGYELKTAGGLGDGGAFEDFAFWQTQSLSFCLEMKSHRREIASLSPTLLVGLTQKKSPTLKEEDTFLTYELVIFRAFSKAIFVKNSNLQLLTSSAD